MEAQLQEEESDLAREGKLLHKYWAHPEYDRAFLSNQQRDILATTDSLIEQVLARLSEYEVVGHTIDRERLLTMPKMDGTPDLVYHWPKLGAALVTDLKSGFANIQQADENLQLRGYAVLVAWNYEPVEKVFTSLLQPRRPPRERITLAIYDRNDLQKSNEQITKIIAATEEPDAPLHAGEEQCRYCKAKLNCPAFRDAVTKQLIPLRPDEKLSKTAREAHIERKIKACSDEQLERIIDACKLADFVANAANDEARERIQAGKFTRYYLGKETEVRVVEDVQRAIGLLALAGVVTRAGAFQSCSITLSDIEDAYRSANKGVTWKEARDKIDRVLKSVIKTETRRARILRKK